MGKNKVFAALLTAILAVGLTLGLAVPAQADAPADLTGQLALASGDTFIKGQTTPAFTVTLSSTNPLTVTSPGFLAVRLGSLYWTFNSTQFSSCTGTYRSLSALSACGLTVKMNGNDAPAGTGAFLLQNDVYVYFPVGSTFGNTGSSVITINFAPAVFNVAVNSTNRFNIIPGLLVDLNGTGASWAGGGAPVIQVLGTSTVTFSRNYGSGTMSPSTATGSQALPANTLSRTGYTFKGWATSFAAAQAGTVTYTDGAVFTYGTDTTLYAVWEADASGGTSDNSGNSTSTDSSSSLATTGSENTWLYGLFASSILILGGVMVLARRMSKR